MKKNRRPKISCLCTFKKDFYSFPYCETCSFSIHSFQLCINFLIKANMRVTAWHMIIRFFHYSHPQGQNLWEKKSFFVVLQVLYDTHLHFFIECSRIRDTLNDSVSWLLISACSVYGMYNQTCFDAYLCKLTKGTQTKLLKYDPLKYA